MHKSIQTVIDLLLDSQHKSYIGEPVSQLEHALQCAFFATKSNNAPPDLTIACLLHDIGHLIGKPKSLGVVEHEIVGANWLRDLGIKGTICELVRSHVAAKRYIVFKNPKYFLKLSDASIETLKVQGGPMSADEAMDFQAKPLFKEKLALRRFDEKAKIENFVVPDLESYRPLLDTYLTSLSF